VCQAVHIMKTLNALGVIVAVTLIALVGIAIIAAAAAASLLVQSANATTDVMTTITSVGGEEQEAVSSTTTTTTNNNVSNAVLGRLFSFGQGTEANVISMDETHMVISYLGNRIITPPNATGVLNSTETGNVTINILPNGLSINQGQAVIMTEDGAAAEEEENATITFVLLSRTNPDGSGNGTGVTFFSTNSTGQLAFLDNMVAISQIEYSPEEGINRFAEWEWKGGTLPFEIGGGASPTTGNQTTTTIPSVLEDEE
jgi:mannitol/fructose-specific phosphotransferase system IIA component